MMIMPQDYTQQFMLINGSYEFPIFVKPDTDLEAKGDA